jgi:hypothetical protein
MKVVSYLKSVPARNANIEKELLLKKFVIGVNKTNDTGVLHTNHTLVNCDVAVIQGWVHTNTATSHLKLRSDIIKTQATANKYVVAADANLFLYNNKENPHGYLRYSFNDVFPTTGIYCDTIPDPTRWQQISMDTGIQLEDYKTNGMNIVLCCQRNGGWSMGTQTVTDWIINTVTTIRKHSSRRIIIRSHPGDKSANTYLRDVKITGLPNCKVTIGTHLDSDLHKAWAVVNHNSSSIVGPLIQGYHGFITDPIKSQCNEVAETDFSKIENPSQFDRQQWLERISMCHWKFEDLESGKCWSHMRNYCQ